MFCCRLEGFPPTHSTCMIVCAPDLPRAGFSCPSNGPAHQRRRASVQPVVNDAEQSKTWAMSRTVALPHTLHPFTTG